MADKAQRLLRVMEAKKRDSESRATFGIEYGRGIVVGIVRAGRRSLGDRGISEVWMSTDSDAGSIGHGVDATSVLRI